MILGATILASCVLGGALEISRVTASNGPILTLDDELQVYARGTTQPKFKIKRGDSGAALRIVIRSKRGATFDFDGAAAVVCLQEEKADGTLGTASRRSATVSSFTDTEATIDYTLAAGDTATAGRFRAEIEITTATGAVLTFSAGSYFYLLVKEDVR
jgi:hypothetical protein